MSDDERSVTDSGDVRRLRRNPAILTERGAEVLREHGIQAQRGDFVHKHHEAMRDRGLLIRDRGAGEDLVRLQELPPDTLGVVFADAFRALASGRGGESFWTHETMARVALAAKQRDGLARGEAKWKRTAERRGQLILSLHDKIGRLQHEVRRLEKVLVGLHRLDNPTAALVRERIERAIGRALRRVESLADFEAIYGGEARFCPDCRVERTDYQGPNGQWLHLCPNCGSERDPVLPRELPAE